MTAVAYAVRISPRSPAPSPSGAWLCMGASWPWVLPGTASLLLFATVLTIVPMETAGRAFAAYGGVYICAFFAWLCFTEGIRPDHWDAVGAFLCIVGAMMILMAPRG